jgi:pimeloyl-ACP methyl ester carboxylesterase
MKPNIIKMLLVLSVWMFVGCGSDLDQPANEVAKGGEVVVDLDGKAIRHSLVEKGLIPENYDKPVFGYKAYKIPYVTEDEHGEPVKVSGLMVIPTGVPSEMKALGFSVVSDDHDTRFGDFEMPTVIAETTNAPEGSPVIFTSMMGFVTLQPDYIGYGDSIDHYHPFLLKRSLANATVDFIKAARKFAEKNSIPLNDQLYLTGYSEGGYAALATLQKIEQEGLMPVTMAAPMSGPYDLELIGLGVLSQPELSVPSFMAYVAYAYALTYDEPIESMVNEPYASKLDDLFDGNRARPQIDPELTRQTTGDGGLFNTTFVGDFLTNTSNWFRVELTENEVYKWAPQTPVRLLHCEGDDVVPYRISELAEGTMQQYGAANVTLLSVEQLLGLPQPVGHSACGPYAYQAVAGIFAQTRQETIGY